ncbi:MAG: biosynthetic arginine decarboxylase [Gammaproteobacteria bacterium]|nr:biosynthetic arginine decarboxylase [Gammaproteobacteria bacterium]
MANTLNEAWTLKRAREFYNIPVWSEGYFDVNQHGHIVAKPDESTEIDLVEVSKEIRARELSLPALIRFPQILQARVLEIDNAFIKSAKAASCSLKHIPYYPIKVNQQRTVIETILSSKVENIGLEVGSKTELLVALGLLDLKQGKLICNGYKDRAYIRIALYAQQMGVDVFLVIENLSELDIIRQESLNIEVIPKLGMRVRTCSVANGKWQNSGGLNAKFGLDARDILICLDKLIQWRYESWLHLLHFHMGSQISNLEEFKVGLSEAMRIYSALVERGFALKFIDVGGGLAVDYASKSDVSYFSRAYSIQDYANTVVNTINDFCKRKDLPIPDVVTENGRAITAHHALLITNVLEVEDHDDKHHDSETDLRDSELYELGKQLLSSIRDNQSISQHLIISFEKLVNDKFHRGEIDLQQRAIAEAILRQCDTRVKGFQTNVDKYYCNFSIFQSMPDVWGLDQIFPIAPLARLNEQPLKQTRLHDLTCDSDGQISQYAVDGELKDHLSLHKPDSKDYLLGFFLLGAYQEVLGDRHNLFGDSHALNVEQYQQQLEVTELEIGDCVNEMLNSIHIKGQQIIDRCKLRLGQMGADSAPTSGMIDEINNALFGYTYLDSIDRPTHRIKR